MITEIVVEDKKQLQSRGIIPQRAAAQNMGRPVLIKDEQWHGEGQPKTPRERKATFHIWGYKRSGGKSGPPAMHTVAILELEDGRITTKLPEQITFLDRG